MSEYPKYDEPCELCGAGANEDCAPTCPTQLEEPAPVHLDDEERYGERAERFDPQTGFLDEGPGYERR